MACQFTTNVTNGRAFLTFCMQSSPQAAVRLLQNVVVALSTSPQLWTVRLDLLSEGEVELRTVLDGDEANAMWRRCSIQDALRELEVLFDCAGGADFALAVRAPGAPWRRLATRRWRMALQFLTAEYEGAFVTAAHGGDSRDRLAREPEPEPSPVVHGAPDDSQTFVEQGRPVISSLPERAPAALSETREE